MIAWQSVSFWWACSWSLLLGHCTASFLSWYIYQRIIIDQSIYFIDFLRIKDYHNMLLISIDWYHLITWVKEILWTGTKNHFWKKSVFFWFTKRERKYIFFWWRTGAMGRGGERSVAYWVILMIHFDVSSYLQFFNLICSETQ